MSFPRQTEFWVTLPSFLSPEMLPGSNRQRKAVLFESHHMYKNQKFRFYKRVDFKETSQRNSTQREPFPQERSEHPGGLRWGSGLILIHCISQLLCKLVMTPNLIRGPGEQTEIVRKRC